MERKTKKVSGKSNKAKAINSLLHKKIAKIELIFHEAIAKDQELTLEKFLRYFHNSASRECFISFFESQIEVERKMRKPGTIKKYLKVFRFLKSYKSCITFSELDYSFTEGLLGCMKTKGFETNTIAGYSSVIKKFINIAIEKGFLKKNPYEKVPIRFIKGKRTFLTENELRRVIELYDSDNVTYKLRKSLRHFIFMCSTSLRFGDLEHLEEDNIISDFLVLGQKKQKIAGPF